MGKVLVIAEKPSVGRDYARVLGCSGKGDGCLIGEHYVVTWAVGHLVELSAPEVYGEQYKRWNLADLPIMPERFRHEVIASSRKQFNLVKEWMNSDQIDSIICGTDSGREGELIFRYIYYMAGCRKPFSRLWVSSMTEEAISAGFNAIKPGSDYDRLYESARCRSEADWLVGMNGTRAYTKRFGGQGVVLSVGRVQTPTLAMIVNRQQEIDAFVPKDYYEVNLQHDKEGQGFSSRYFRLEEDGKSRNTRVDEAGQAQAILDKAAAAGQARVTKITKTPKKVSPPLLYDLTELQRDGNRKLGLSANQVLEIAQALYEKHKLLTYPRTDSRYLSDDMKTVIPSTLKAISVGELESLVSGIPQPLSFSKRIIDNSKITDHHAIIPTTKRPNLDSLSDLERKIYLLVCRRLIEVFYPPYEYEVTDAELEAGGESFFARGRIVKAPGFTVVSGQKGASGDDEDEDSGQLPALKKGETVVICGGELQKKQTQPPKPFTEATLLTAMEYAGKYIEDEAAREKLLEEMGKLSLGTPATRAAIIERLLKVGYITRKGKSLLPTEKGKELIRIVPDQLKSPEMTGKWERALEHIYQGGMDPVRFMDSIRRYVVYLVDDAKNAPPDRARFESKTEHPAAKSSRTQDAEKAQRTPRVAYGTCPLCKQGEVYKNSKAFYCSRFREGCKLTVWQDCLDRYGLKLDDDMMKEVLEKGQKRISMTQPTTHEKGEATLCFSEGGRLDIKDYQQV